MTSIRKKPTMLGARRNTAEQEREQFQKSQEASFRKAINDEELPVKMKHVRSLIIGTHTDRNGSVFWSLVTLSPPLHTDITAWKFCHTLHLILRDGHIKVLRDSIDHMTRIRNMGEHFRHLPMGYGSLIRKYCSLLLCKLSFHQHYPKFPGTLQVSADELLAIAENDANNFFEMAVEMLEYMENILNLYEAVFRSLDPSRANSMTKLGQCRLAPLIPCIQDSSCLYDFIVRILFQLHKVVPIDMLSGHRTRFNSQFKLLQQFYANTRNLQYFKTLIQVPHLPQVPPNFLIEAELGSHVTPVVVMEEEQIDPSDVIGSYSTLIDTSEPEPPPVPPHPHPDVINSHNGLTDASLIAEKDSLIESLNDELRMARNAVQTVRSEASFTQDLMKLKITDLESSISELDSELIAERHSKESILVQVEAAAASAEAVTKLNSEETRRRSAEEKYTKLKEVYLKLREEHISLIRTKAELEKSLAKESENVQRETQLRKNIETNLAKMKDLIGDQMEFQKLVQLAEEEKLILEKNLSDALQDNEETTLSKEALQMALSEMKLNMHQQNEELLNEISESQINWEHDLDECLVVAVDSCILVIAFSLSHFDFEPHSLVKSIPEYTLSYRSSMEESLTSLSTTYSSYLNDKKQTKCTIKDCTMFGHFISSFLLYAKATSHTSPDLETAEDLVGALEELSKYATDLLDDIKNKTSIEGNENLFRNQLDRCFELVSKCEDISPSDEDVATIIEREMESMDKAIFEAVQKFTKLLEDSRAKDTGMRLEVNEGILGTCGDLMDAVKVLVQRASQLQVEIVASGRGGSSPKEFYKRNHRWTEGLISGAKAVAIACQALLCSADEVAKGEGKFEKVIVASREIAASSMQLVMASRVKAGKSSDKLSNLNSAAKVISNLTGTVVATAKSCRDKVSEATTLDFSKLSLHETKRREMDTLVSVLETEKKLDTERAKLSELRRHHYQLAGALEGWEIEDVPK